MAFAKQEIIDALELMPHPEGGHYREVYRGAALPFELPGRGSRASSTAIYFLLASGEFSAFHVVDSDEAWHHYEGCALELVTIDHDRELKSVRLGKNLSAGEVPLYVVAAGVWQAARPLGSDWALCGCTVAPGFDFADFRLPARAELCARFPEHASLIASLTR